METPIVELEEFQSEDIMSVNHARLAYNLVKVLIPYEQQYDIMPELEFELSVDRAKPDISVCHKIPVDWIRDTVRWKEPPVTAIEILSPRQAYNDLTDKVYDNYFPSGVQSAWIILPSVKTVQLFLPGESVKHFTEGTFQDPATGIELSLAAIFN